MNTKYFKINKQGVIIGNEFGVFNLSLLNTLTKKPFWFFRIFIKGREMKITFKNLNK